MNYKIRYVLNKIKQSVLRLFFYVKKFMRMKIYHPEKFNNLLNCKNRHLNQRCFIIATGPSLTMDDVKKLKDELTIGVNSLCLWFDELGWETTYMGVQDERAYNKLAPNLCGLKPEALILSDWVVNKCKLNTLTDEIIFPLNFLNHHTFHSNYGSRFSTDAYAEVFDGYSVTFSMIQIAAYMGCREIYLLGADCNYNFEKTEEQYAVSHGIIQENPQYAGYKMIKAYESIKNDLDINGVRVYNAGRGGMLEVFERVDLDDVLS